MIKLWTIALVVTFVSPSFGHHNEEKVLRPTILPFKVVRGKRSIFSSEYYCWTQWFDRDDPSGTGDWETLSDLLKQYPNEICPNPVDVEATTLSGTPAKETGEVLYKYDKTSGLVCRNEDQKEGMCSNYRVRFSCPSAFCSEEVCWTEWFDRDNPSGTGDWELLSDLRTENPGKICETPQYIEAKPKSLLASFIGDNIYIYNPTQGFVCRNEDQTFVNCWDYEVRFGCCQ